jgi:hypothetical protein
MASVLHPTGPPGEIQMTVLTDIANALDTYPLDETTIEIVDVAVQTGTGPEVNKNEIFKFKVRVTNNGHVNMTDVFLHVNGTDTSGTMVSFNPDKGFAKDKTLKVGPLVVNGGGASSTTDYLYFKAPPSAMPSGTKLVESHVFDWSTDFVGHFVSNHTKDEDSATVAYPTATFAAQVFP